MDPNPIIAWQTIFSISQLRIVGPSKNVEFINILKNQGFEGY